MTADDDDDLPRPVPVFHHSALFTALFGLQLAAYALEDFHQRHQPQECSCTSQDVKDERQCPACMRLHLIEACGHEAYAVSNVASWLTGWLAPLPQALIDFEDALDTAACWPDGQELAELIRLATQAIGCNANAMAQTQAPSRFELPREDLARRVATIFAPSNN